MRRRSQFHFVTLLMAGFAGSLHAAPGDTELLFDIVINGGSFSAPAAALAAARTNPDAQILLIETTDWLGGQATSQGVSAIDNSYHAPANSIMRLNETTYYPADYLDWLDRMKNAPVFEPGEGYSGSSGWVSRHCYDPRTGAWALDEMVGEVPNITVMKLTVLKSTTTVNLTDEVGAGKKITELRLIQRTPVGGYVPFTDFLSNELPDWYALADSPRFTKETFTVTARDVDTGLVVIEASELGDAMVLSGATYTQGREVSTEKVAENGTLPPINDAQSMATVYPFAMSTTTVSSAEAELKTPWADFDAYYATRSADYFGLGTSTWANVWTYRRLLLGPGGGSGTSTVTAGDVSMQNWNPGNDYRQGNWLLGKAATDAQAATDWLGATNLTNLGVAEKQAVAWYFWMKARRPGGFPTADTRFLRGTDPLNMMGSGHGLAKFPYIRCTRRLVGLDNFRITGRYFVNTQASGYANETSYRYFDSVGIGSYSTDVRPLLTSTGIAPLFSLPAPFYIPYRALASRNVRNLLASGKTIAQTYVTNSAYRLHPIEWQSGSAAGTAAGLMVRDGVANHKLLAIPALRELQAEVATNAPIRWAYRSESALPPQDGDLIVYDFRTLPRGTPYDVEVYHPTAVRAEIHINGGIVGQTTTRSNGRLLYSGTDVVSLVTPAFFEAKCYDGGGALIATLSTNVTVTPFVPTCEDDTTVTDNDDTDGYFSVTGSWGAGTAQADKYCPAKPGASYTLTNSNDGNRISTWRLRIPTPGTYRVQTWFSASGNRAADARFSITHRDGVATRNINQTTQGGQWVDMGTHTFLGTATDQVQLRNNHATNGQFIIADAVRATLIAPLTGAPVGWLIE